MIGRAILLAGVVGAIVFVAEWSMESRVEDSLAPGAAEPDPDPFLRAAFLEEFDASGRLRMRIHAARIAFDLADESVTLDDLSLDYLALPAQIWHLTARHGEAPKGFSVVHLQGDVVLSGTRDREPRNATLRTERLTLDTAGQIARSDWPVRVEIGRHGLLATGFVANMKHETLRLESRVHGQFSP